MEVKYDGYLRSHYPSPATSLLLLYSISSPDIFIPNIHLALQNGNKNYLVNMHLSIAVLAAYLATITVAVPIAPRTCKPIHPLKSIKKD